MVHGTIERYYKRVDEITEMFQERYPSWLHNFWDAMIDIHEILYRATYIEVNFTNK